MAEKSLKKKYGEEFIIHNAWDRDQTRFYADCSPKDNRGVVFRACIYKNGKGVYGDEYPETVVALEVDEIFRDGFEEIFVEKPAISEDTVEKEYRYLAETFLQKGIEEGIGKDQFGGVGICFADENMLRESAEYFLTHANIRGEFDSEISRYIWFNGYYEDGKLKQSYEEYLEKRIQSESK
ncbi:MAG: hypothetical protein NC079_08780 [Clostridium sp.]|nr:hypothetical protein [Acetatifactor muris]MCM1563689.1 hypothetical protein [Clostridium sp.]